MYSAPPAGAPPSLTITSPSKGATLKGSKASIAASAGDASGVQAVEFYVDGALLARDTSAPYAANWNLRRAAAGIHSIRVRAIDTRGNAAEQTIEVTVSR